MHRFYLNSVVFIHRVAANALILLVESGDCLVSQVSLNGSK